MWMSQTSSNQSDGDRSSIAFLTQIMYSLPGQSAHRQASATCGIIPNPSTIKNWSCEMLQVTCHPLPTTRHPLPISRQPPATCHLSPVTHHCRWSLVAHTDHNTTMSQLSPLPPNTTPSHVACCLSPTNTNTNHGTVWPRHNQHNPPPHQPRHLPSLTNPNHGGSSGNHNHGMAMSQPASPTTMSTTPSPIAHQHQP